jgi:phosphogluconate dehydratase
LKPHHALLEVTERIRDRSASSRRRYLDLVDRAGEAAPRRAALSCTNLAHGCAAAPAADKRQLGGGAGPNLAIVSAYNDMLSAHQPYAAYPQWIKEAARSVGATAQFAGGVPAMCDGITQGRTGMELSLFSRDVIAQGTAIALAHDMFDAALYLGICDKIVPGLLIGALSFGHLPAIFVPAGPMPTGLSNEEKAKFRQRHAAGTLGRIELLEAESRAYHAPGTCTFYGTANSNQVLMEVMGLHLPGAAFVPPGTTLREALTRQAAIRATEITPQGREYIPVGRVVDEKAIVNAVVGLLATGGSTNHTIHLVAIARAAGIVIDWEDFAALSRVVPLIARIYPNGGADVNQFHAAGGTAYLIGELLAGGLLHEDVLTVCGPGLQRYARQPALSGDRLDWRNAPRAGTDATVLGSLAAPFSADGGIRLLRGNLGRAVIKVSAVKPEHRVVEAPARVFSGQEEFLAAAARGELNRDFVAVIRFQGPRANGMPELHGLTPTLANLQDAGHRVALVTDGRMSGASGKIPAAIHLSPECLAGGPLARVRDGDPIRLDADAGTLDVLVPAAEFAARPAAQADLTANRSGMGRQLFGAMRAAARSAEEGATTFDPIEP